MKDKALQVWLTKEEISIIIRRLKYNESGILYSNDKVNLKSATLKLNNAYNKQGKENEKNT